MKPVVVIGGGTSVRELDLVSVSKLTTITVNNAWKIAPWAVEAFAGDGRWWDYWGEGEKLLKNFKGKISSTDQVKADIVRKNNRVIKYRLSDNPKDLEDPNAVLAPDSGSKALCRAYHMGGNPILLAGFDLCTDKNGTTHWHSEHNERPSKHSWENFGARHFQIYTALVDKGVMVYRITPLGDKRIPFRPIEDFIDESQPRLRPDAPQPRSQPQGNTVVCGSGLRKL